MFASDSSILPEDLATQSVKLKEEQLRREEEKVISFVIGFRSLLRVSPVARDRNESSARDQRKEARATCKGRISQVRQQIFASHFFVANAMSTHRNLESRLAAQGSQGDY